MTEDNERIQPSPVISALFDAFFFFVGTYVLESGWNNSVHAMFRTVPVMTYTNALAFMMSIYVLGRIFSAGFMAQLLRVAEDILQQANGLPPQRIVVVDDEEDAEEQNPPRDDG